MAIWLGLLAAAMPGGMPFLPMEDAMSSMSWTSFALPSSCASFWISWKLLLSDHHGKRRATLACSTERTENSGCHRSSMALELCMAQLLLSQQVQRVYAVAIARSRGRGANRMQLPYPETVLWHPSRVCSQQSMAMNLAKETQQRSPHPGPPHVARCCRIAEH